MSDEHLCEQMNQLAEALCGDRDASFEEMMATTKRLRVAEIILTTSQNALAQRTAIKEAADQLLVEIEALAEF